MKELKIQQEKQRENERRMQKENQNKLNEQAVKSRATKVLSAK